MNQSGTLKQWCVPIPLGSPTVSSKRSFSTARGHRTAGSEHRVSVRGCTGRGMGMGTRVGIPGEYPAARDPPLNGAQTAKRAPDTPAGVGVGGLGAVPRVPPLVCAAPRTHPPGPVGALQAPPWYGPPLSTARGQ